MTDNINRFNEAVAQIFAEMYSNFPVRICVDPYEIMGYDERGEYIEGTWKDTLSAEDGDFFYYTLRWLHDTGYIVGSISHTHETNLTLSHKGLELLKSMPKSVNNSKTLGEQLREAVKSGAKKSAADLVSSGLSTNNIVSLFSSVLS